MASKYNFKRIENSIDFIEDIALAFKKSRVLLTASELNIFETIGYRSLSAKEIAEQNDLDEKATERLLNALVGLDLLDKKDQTYSNTEESLKHLLKGSDEYISTIDHLANLWDAWTDLTDTIKTGQTTHTIPLSEKSDEWIESYMNSVFWKSNLQVQEIISHINLNGVKKVLDLGGGKGAFTYQIAKKLPSSSITLFDLESITKFTDKYLSMNGVRDQVTILNGDFIKDDFGKGYDLIYLGNVICLQSIWENVKLLQKCYDALNYGGKVVIADMIINDNRTKPLEHTIFSLNMLLNTDAGDVYTETDIWIMLKESWFKDIKLIKTKYDISLMTGVR